MPVKTQNRCSLPPADAFLPGGLVFTSGWLEKLAGGRKCDGFPIIPSEQTVPLSVLPPSPEYLIVPVARVAAMLAMLHSTQVARLWFHSPTIRRFCYTGAVPFGNAFPE